VVVYACARLFLFCNVQIKEIQPVSVLYGGCKEVGKIGLLGIQMLRLCRFVEVNCNYG
jgi:hypothetical protein